MHAKAISIGSISDYCKTLDSNSSVANDPQDFDQLNPVKSETSTRL